MKLTAVVAATASWKRNSAGPKQHCLPGANLTVHKCLLGQQDWRKHIAEDAQAA